jgi:HlyD family secretion protein
MKTRSVVIGVVIVAAVAVAATVYLRRGSGGTEQKYRTEAVSRGTVAETVTATGTISAVTTVQVGSQVSGIIDHLYADFNSPVKHGQLLAELDPTPFQAQVAQRKADLERAVVQMRNAEITWKRNERLLGQGLVAQSDFDTAKAAYDASSADVDLAKAALSQTQTNLSYTKIHSPIDGVVVARQYDIGQTVAASFQAPTLFTIAEDLTKMQVLADVDQSDIGRVATGQTVRFTVDAFPEETFRGKISQIRLNATQNQNVITYPVVIDVPNPDGKLKPTMTADVTIEVAHVADILRVPNAALRFRPIETSAPAPSDSSAAQAATPGGRPGGGFAGAAQALPGGERGKREQTVHVLEADGSLKSVAVKPGISDGRFTAILEGDLKEGDKIAVGMATAKSDASAGFPGMGGRGGRH